MIRSNDQASCRLEALKRPWMLLVLPASGGGSA